jgi:hypothetical protein
LMQDGTAGPWFLTVAGPGTDGGVSHDKRVLESTSALTKSTPAKRQDTSVPIANERPRTERARPPDASPVEGSNDSRTSVCRKRNSRAPSIGALPAESDTAAIPTEEGGVRQVTECAPTLTGGTLVELKRQAVTSPTGDSAVIVTSVPPLAAPDVGTTESNRTAAAYAKPLLLVVKSRPLKESSRTPVPPAGRPGRLHRASVVEVATPPNVAVPFESLTRHVTSPFRKALPETVSIVVPFPAETVEGESEAMTGVAEYVKLTACFVHSKPLPETCNVTPPGDCAGDEHETSVELTMVASVTSEPKRQAPPDSTLKFIPVTFTIVPPTSGPTEGMTDSTQCVDEKVTTTPLLE